MAAKLGLQGPMGTTIRVSSTPYGIEEGLNAGMWTVAVSTTGLAEPFQSGAESEQKRQKRVRKDRTRSRQGVKANLYTDKAACMSNYASWATHLTELRQ